MVDEKIIDAIYSTIDHKNICSKWTREHKNKYVITGMQAGERSFRTRIGRVVQVRLGVGDFGSDNVLLRHYDNELRQHTNQSFWIIPDEFTDYLNKCFKDTFLDDSDSYEYTLSGGKFPEKGFIVESPIKDGESPPMRDIKNAIKTQLSNCEKQT